MTSKTSFSAKAQQNKNLKADTNTDRNTVFNITHGTDSEPVFDSARGTGSRPVSDSVRGTGSRPVSDSARGTGSDSVFDSARGTDSPSEGSGNDNSFGNSFARAGRNTGFFMRQRELCKRRLWPIALTFLSLLLYNVVTLTTSLSIASQGEAEEGMTSAERAIQISNTLKSFLGFQNPSVLMIIVPIAAVLAIEGFSWMDNRRAVDFYESQPLSRGKRFLDICIGSFMYFTFAYAITLEAGLLIAGIFHALTRAILAEILWNFLCVIALFLAVYSLGVLASMLTGNAIITWLAFLVLILYEPLFKAAMGGYSSEYLTTYNGASEGWLRVDFLNPVAHYYNSTVFDIKMPLALLMIAVLYFALAWVSYRLRKNEYAGTPVVFGPVRTIVRIAMSVLVGLTIGLFFSFVRNTFFIILIWMILFTVIAACIMQIIYELDFRALFHRPLEILASAAIVILIFFAFLFDIAGYDRYIPDPEKVQDAALYMKSDDNTFISEDGNYDYDKIFSAEYMHLTNVEDVTALAGFCQEYTRSKNAKINLLGSGKTSIAAEDIENTANTADDNNNNDNDSGTNTTGEGIKDTAKSSDESWDFTVLYRMKNGKKVFRSFTIPSTIDPSMMDAVTKTKKYREGAFNIYHDKYIRKALKKSARIQMSYANGIDYLPGFLIDSSMYEEFRKVYTKDLEQFSYSFARQNRPIGSIGISAAADSSQNDIPAISCSVYPTFSHTIDFLKKNGIWLEALDLSQIPSGDYLDLTAEQQAIIDKLDIGALSGPFNAYSN